MNHDSPLFEVEEQPPSPEEIERQRVREEYRAKLAEKLKDPEFRKIEGFPIGTDEAILALSDPPYYTACPNPFIEELLTEHRKPFDPDKDDYHREPFAADVSEGKNHPIYNAHSYHTKVPHRAIMRYILHYTEPGDVVYDGFCGTGMTGVAAQLCGDRDEVEALGYKIDENGSIWVKEEWESAQALKSGRDNPHLHHTEPAPFSRLGARLAVLNDLSPAATFIAHQYNSPISSENFEHEAKRILSEVGQKTDWMYKTLHREPNLWTDEEWEAYVEKCAKGIAACRSEFEARAYIEDIAAESRLGDINFMVWSDVFHCPSCVSEFVFSDVALEVATGKVRETFSCPACGAELSKSKCTRKQNVSFDSALGTSIRQSVQVPYLVNYTVGSKRHQKLTDPLDVALASFFETLAIPPTFPTVAMPKGVNTAQPISSHGLTHIHHFFTRRSQLAISSIREAVASANESLRGYLWFFAEQVIQGMAKISRYAPTHFSQVNRFLSGTLYIGSHIVEVPPRYILDGKAKRLKSALYKSSVRAFVSTASASAKDAVQADFIFTDPPFGGNLNYSELSFFWEAFHNVYTENKPEAIANAAQGKGVIEYQQLMQQCFEAFYVKLRAGHWMTVEFHNSENSIWNAIQKALERVGFVIADVRVLDKKSYTHKQVTTSGATKMDLVISCYKPSSSFIAEFEKDKGTPKGVSEFIAQHLEMLPVAPTTGNGSLESLAERTLGVLYDRMIAYHLVRGARIPLSASEFRILLEELCSERDGMYFLPSQVVRYDALKSRGIEAEQLSIFVRDEKSAVHWVRSELEREPHTLGELTPKFMQASQDWGQHEEMPELRDLLQQYFIRQDDERWTVPDPDNEKHLEEMRRKAMLREFTEYIKRPGQLKRFRTEAVLAGFAHCWETRQYDVIVGVCEKIPLKVLQESQDLVMYSDIARERAPEKVKQFEFKWE